MKKIMVLLFTVLILLSGCRVNMTSNTSTNAVSTGETIVIPALDGQGDVLEPTILDGLFIFQNRFTISYPIIEGIENYSAVNTAIRDSIEEDLVSSLGENPELERFNLNCEFEIIDSKYSSIHYVGSCFATKAAHPTILHFTYVFDISSGERISVEDLVTLDDVFLYKFRTAWKEQVISELEGYISDQTNDELRTKIRHSKYVLSKNSITIIYEVPHAVGDYALIVLSSTKTGDGSVSSSG